MIYAMPEEELKPHHEDLVSNKAYDSVENNLDGPKSIPCLIDSAERGTQRIIHPIRKLRNNRRAEHSHDRTNDIYCECESDSNEHMLSA